MTEDLPPEPDAAPGLPHPRLSPQLYGHQGAEALFLDAARAGRIHHAWMLTGPKGVGKATLAWRLVRGLLVGDLDARDSLDFAPDSAPYRQTAALSAPGLFLCRRGYDDKTKRLRTTIGVDEVRKMKSFFAMSAAEGGWRIGVIDALDEMGPGAANALLKLLEEPPARTVFFLIAHQPARLLPTIRSRCRMLPLSPLNPGEMTAALTDQGLGEDAPHLAPLAEGALGFAHLLAQEEGLALYDTILALMGQIPGFDRPRALALAASAVGRGAEARYDLILRLWPMAVARLVRLALGAPADSAYPGEPALAAQLVPTLARAQALASALAEIEARALHARRVNLDPAQVIFDMIRETDAVIAR